MFSEVKFYLFTLHCDCCPPSSPFSPESYPPPLLLWEGQGPPWISHILAHQVTEGLGASSPTEARQGRWVRRKLPFLKDSLQGFSFREVLFEVIYLVYINTHTQFVSFHKDSVWPRNVNRVRVCSHVVPISSRWRKNNFSELFFFLMYLWFLNSEVLSVKLLDRFAEHLSTPACSYSSQLAESM